METDEPVGQVYERKMEPPQLMDQSSNSRSPTEDTDDATIDLVEYAVLLPDSFAVIDSTYDDNSL